MICFKNGKQVDSIPLLDRAFHYGDGCFTTARFHHNIFELKERHFLRLKNTAERLLLQVDFNLLEQTIQLLYASYASVEGHLKIIFSRGEGQRGYALPEHAADVYVIFYPQETTGFQIEYIRSGILQQTLGLTMPHLVGLKTLNRLEQVLLKHEAQQHHWTEALVTDVQGAIVEGVSSNCFIRINDTWITPELRYNGIHGVMRAHILTLMQQKQICCTQRYIDMDEIKQIQSLFFCNSLSAMKAVQELNGRPLDLQPCVELFQTLQLNRLNEYTQN